jgi:hypothetical protein
MRSPLLKGFWRHFCFACVFTRFVFDMRSTSSKFDEA